MWPCHSYRTPMRRLTPRASYSTTASSAIPGGPHRLHAIHYAPKSAATAALAPVVILHGVLGSSAHWKPAAGALSEAGHPVMTLDLRNHGKSPWSSHMNLAALADDVVHTLHQAWDDPSHPHWTPDMPAHLIGHSLGGKVALHAAGRMQPASTIIVDISPDAYTPDRAAWQEVMSLTQAAAALNLAELKSRSAAKDALVRLGVVCVRWCA